MPSESKYESQKVKKTRRLTELSRWILENVGDGIERGDITEKFFGLERRYCGSWIETCMSRRKQREYDREYRKKQPLVSYSLRRLERLGLVRPIRKRQYVKAVQLTDKGMALAQEFKDKKSIGISNQNGPRV